MIGEEVSEVWKMEAEIEAPHPSSALVFCLRGLLGSAGSAAAVTFNLFSVHGGKLTRTQEIVPERAHYLTRYHATHTHPHTRQEDKLVCSQTHLCTHSEISAGLQEFQENAPK